MLWIAAECGLSEARLIEAAAACARVGYRFNPESQERLEPAVRLAERGGRGELSSEDCMRVSDEIHEYQGAILEELRLPNVLSAAHVTGAVSQLAAAAAYRADRAACVMLAVGCAGQVAGAGYYLEGDESQLALHSRTAEAVRGLIRVSELVMPQT